MAEKRKLLAEIEKCYKKIDEGLELFEEIMEKMQEANSDNQRDKYQDDLKKEIKKLQRLRDQVKNWQNSSDIKDKDKLIHYRRLIESRMEQFKDVERENKTKPHSKLGLSAEEKLDPREKEKLDTMDWVQNVIRQLEEEVDRCETQVESLSSAETGKKRGKKEDSKSKVDREKKIESFKAHIERLKYHVTKLEICNRMLSNESLDNRLVMSTLKEQLESYIEMLDGPLEDKIAYDPEDIYDDLNLDKLCQQIGGVNLMSMDDEHKENGHDLGIDTETGAVSSSRHGSGENGQPPSPAGRRVTMPLSMTSPHQNSSSGMTAEPKRLISKEHSLDRPKSPALTATAVPAPPPPGIPYNSVAAGRSTTTPIPVTPASPIAPAPPAVIPTPASPAPSFTAPSPVVQTKPINLITTIPPSNEPNRNNEIEIAKTDEKKDTSCENPSPNLAAATDKSSSEKSENEAVEDIDETPSTASKKDSVASRGSSNDQNEVVLENVNGEVSKTSTPSSIGGGMADDSALRSLRLSQQNSTNIASKEPKRAHIPAWLGASPLGRAPNTQEYDVQLAALELAVTKTSLPLDSERPRNYLPKMTYPTPSYYTANAPANSDTLEYYLRLTPDTLFFVFYYMEGTKAQLLAAKALKKLSWRFHTKYLTWFQRHEEPKQITDDFEQGTYVYFDFEKWSQRKKEAFTFEYKFLEDKDFD